MNRMHYLMIATGVAGALAIAGACHHDNPQPMSAGSPQGSNGQSNVGGASMESSATGGAPGSAPGDSYRNTGTDPATGMLVDGGVGDAMTR